MKFIRSNLPVRFEPKRNAPSVNMQHVFSHYIGGRYLTILLLVAFVENGGPCKCGNTIDDDHLLV